MCEIDPGAFASALLYHMVRLQVMKTGPDLKPAEFEKAVRLTIRKHNLKMCGRFIDLRNQDIEYISDLVTEAVNQERISQALLDIAQVKHDIERDEAAWN